MVHKPVWDPEYGCVFYTPRFSYSVSETTVRGGVLVPSRVVHAVYGEVYRAGVWGPGG